MVRHLIYPPRREPAGAKGKKKKRGGVTAPSKPTPRTPLLKPPVPPTGHVRREMTVQEKRQTAWDLRIEGYAIVDIAKSLDVTENRVYQMLRELGADTAKYTEATKEEYRTLELARLDKLLVTHWKFRDVTKNATVILNILERKHKLLGIESTHKHVTVDAPDVGVSLANLDLNKLSNEELEWLEIIIAKAMPQEVSVIEAQFEALPAPAQGSAEDGPV